MISQHFRLPLPESQFMYYNLFSTCIRSTKLPVCLSQLSYRSPPESPLWNEHRHSRYLLRPICSAPDQTDFAYKRISPHNSKEILHIYGKLRFSAHEQSKKLLFQSPFSCEFPKVFAYTHYTVNSCKFYVHNLEASEVCAQSVCSIQSLKLYMQNAQQNGAAQNRPEVLFNRVGGEINISPTSHTTVRAVRHSAV